MATTMFTNPYDAQLSADSARRKEMRDVAKMDAYDYHAYQAGLSSQEAGRALGGMMGMQTPEQAKQAKIEEIMGQYGEGAKSYEQLMQIADSFRDAGMLDLWEQTMGMAKDIKVDAVEQTTRARDIEKHASIIGCDWNDPTPDDDGNNCKQRALASYRATVRAGSGEKFEGAYATELGKEIVQENRELIKSAENAVNALLKTNDVLDLLDEGKIHTGFFAEFKTNISRILAVAGDDESSGYASRTQLLEALLGSDVFPMIKQLGIGARGLDTPEERKFLLKVMTGEKTMEASTIRRMTEIRQRINLVIIEKYNDKVETGGFDRYSKLSKIPVNAISLKGLVKAKVPANAKEVFKDGISYMFDEETGKMYLNGREVDLSK
jgi:uncharacterized protein YjgD (DUF1641 family)